MNTSKRLASFLSILVAAGTLAACSGAAEGTDSTEAAPGEGARKEAIGVLPTPAVDSDAEAPLGQFVCGPNLNCDGNTTFCNVYENGGGVLRPPTFPPTPPAATYSCPPLPASCASSAAPDCACIVPAPFGPQPELPYLRTCVNVTGGSIVTVRNLLLPLTETSP